jgi:hypothetical protein
VTGGARGSLLSFNQDEKVTSVYVSVRQYTLSYVSIPPSAYVSGSFHLFWGDEKKMGKETGKRQKRRRKEDEKKTKEENEEREVSLSMCTC